MVENGSIGGARALPPREPHDEFLELCAISTTGSLSAEEQMRLEDHLSGCLACREALEQYKSVITTVIPALAPEPVSEEPDGAADWSLEQAEAELFARLEGDGGEPRLQEGREEALIHQVDEVRKRQLQAGDSLWRHVWWQYAAGLLLIAALGLSLYRIGTRHGTEIARLTPGSVQPEQLSAERQTGQPANLTRTNEESVRKDTQISALRAQLDERSTEIANLKARQAQTESDLKDTNTDQNRLKQDRADVAQQLDLAQANLTTVQQKLDAAMSERSQEVARADALEEKVKQLTASIQGRDQELAREQELLDHDRDIRELMGSRDLYVAEVYDVAKTGATQKAFGRVFYTKAKSLIFYAYDLDQQPGIKDAGSFQVWGRRGQDRDQAINLGILFQDNASKKRWVLKSNNPTTLAQIDAVFVTVEPNGGSPHPSGKPLLFAYLHIEPNHP